LASWERINNMLTEPIEIRDKNRSKGSEPSEIEGEIEFRNVGFKYPGSDEFAIRNINMKISAGSNSAIVGRTGAGKTTLVNLIPRLFDPTEGDIFVDGINVKDWNLPNLRKSIGYVPQETFLFSTTVKENIAFGVEDASMKQIEEAADSAQVLDNILDFEKKFETLVGERGITLSGGQKQRTAIARAIIKKPGIVIFDDSLSAVDTKTEDAILEHLRVKLAHVTTIMISHRISTIKNADTIFYIQEGSIVEAGTHDELINVEGRYSEMYRKQLLEQELAQI
ncbi:MAG: ATP-binding cassette domain-containing protein, partial [Balneolaceae bacterium]|nr:ATP-binding cassette domain-containing protein [Balneolaceae bacterium]